MARADIESIGPYELHHPKKFPAITEDPFHLLDFLLASPDIDTFHSAIDIGTATGVIPILLAAKTNISRISGVEIDEESAIQAKENVERNSLSKRITIINKDFRELAEIVNKDSYDIVISNPPYIKEGHGRESTDVKRMTARSERFGNLKELIKVTEYLLSDMGRLFLIFPVLRKAELLDELNSLGFNVVRTEFVNANAGAGAKRFMIEAGRASG